jgi:mannose/cellobiose epimerase-like protein (N-acyl-D-glucosamine 2-epimerase family)
MTTEMHIEQLGVLQEALSNWLCAEALPLWAQAGVDDQQGGFFEKLSAHGQALEEPRRTRVVARQVYVFAVARKLGWSDTSPDLVAHGLTFLQGKLRQPDGLYASAVHPDGRMANAQFDLYEQAFALFALASANSLSPEAAQADLHAAASHTLAALKRGYKHPHIGFQESAPPSAPLKANPHMHLFEAALAWAGCASPDATMWNTLADELATLALGKLIDPTNGSLSELFDSHWQPWGEQRIVEPGHQFEWAWLLLRWGRLRQRPDALSAAQRLIDLAEQHGICAQRGVAVNALNQHLTVTDAQAKLWPQTERIKAWCLRAELASTPQALDTAVAGIERAAHGLWPYLKHPHPGLWHEVMLSDGSFSSEACRASSFYHIVCAIEAVHDAALTLSQQVGKLQP